MHFPHGHNSTFFVFFLCTFQASEFSEDRQRIVETAVVYPTCLEVDGGDRWRTDGLLVDLRPYMDTSPFTVLDTFSILRAYTLFRSMGLRHLPVVDPCNRVVGILTRKDMQVCGAMCFYGQLLQVQCLNL